jgi:branched-chain amino acid transport system ATP-binding protein
MIAFAYGMATGSSGLPDDIDATCDSLALTGLDRRANEVTFGELRLIEVARALVQRPTLVMLDEPFSGVGDSGIKAITDALRTACRQGCAVLVVDHNVDLLVELVDRLALLAEGRILVEGRVNECLRNDVFRETYIGAV